MTQRCGGNNGLDLAIVSKYFFFLFRVGIFYDGDYYFGTAKKREFI